MTQENINIAELLKDCPKGMELDCTMFDTKVIYKGLDKSTLIPIHPIVVQTEHGFEFELTKYGQIYNIVGSKCVIFPKGKTTWEGFVPPCKFKDGDIVITALGNIAIIRKHVGEESFYTYGLMVDNNFYKNKVTKVCVNRLATEEEKQKLFDAIKENGHKWDEETKTLEKLTEQKFDITTLKPFDKVLVRDGAGLWRPSLFGNDMIVGYRYFTSNGSYKECIPYEGNEHLLGKTDDCDEFYKTWK